MPPTPNPIHAVYSQRMFVTGHGYPIWDGEPEDAEHEIELGTVGYLEFGKLWLLFNAMKPEDHLYQKYGVPPHFEVFQPPELHISKWPSIKYPVISSESVTKVHMEASTSAGVPGLEDLASGGVGVKFVSKNKAGAFLLLDVPVETVRITNKRRIVTHLRQHFHHWLEFANHNRGLELKPGDLFFVSGTTKTTRWACSAFEGNCRNKEGFLNAQVMSVGSVDIKMSFSSEDAVRKESNYGPTSLGPPGGDAHFPALTRDSGPAASLPRNQCVFIHYYKARTRFLGLPRTFRASAGPHELPENEDPDDSSPTDAVPAEYPSSDEDSDDQPISNVHDPVEYLLDYIFARSDAAIAIACDLDLYALFHGREFPYDIPAALEAIQPAVEVDEDGAGTIDVSHRVLHELQPNTAESASPAPAGADMPQIGNLTLEEGPEPTVEATGNATQQIAQVQSSPAAQHDVEDDFPMGPPHISPDEPEQTVQPEPDPMTESLVSEPRLEPPDAPPPVAPGADDDDDDGYEGLTEEEARLRREQKLPVLQWQPAAAGHTGAVTALTYSHDSKLVATGSDDTSIVIWDASNQTIVRKWDAHTDVVWALAFSPDDQRLASAGADSNVMVWSVETGECLATLHGHEETIHAMAWSADGKWIASGSDDMSVRLWDADTLEQKTVFEGHEAMVTFVRFSHDGRWLASGGADYCTRLWDVEAGTLHAVLRGHKGMVWHADFDADNRRIVTCSDDASARVWSVETGQMLVTIHEHQGPVWNVAFSKDGTRVLTASSDSTMKLCDSFTGERKRALTGHESMINTAVFSPDGKYVASASSDNTVRLWRAADGSPLATFNEHEDKVTLVMFGPDGNTLASGSDDGTVRIRLVKEWDPDRAEEDEDDGDNNEEVEKDDEKPVEDVKGKKVAV